MTAYQFALTVHVLALVAAASASGIVHLAAARRAAAPTLRTAMEWGRVIASASRVFPIVVLLLVATGAYMVSGRWSWGLGWVEAGIAGSIALLASGATLGKRGASEARANIERLQRAGHDLPNDAAPDGIAAILAEANTGLALAIVVVMTLKPALAGSLAVLAVGAAIGAFRGYRIASAASTTETVAEAEAA